MYFDHFGLNQSPFSITPNPEFFFTGNKRGAILEALIYAITHGEGIVKVTGEVGSGKTMLCRMLENMLPENVEVIYLVNPTLTREEVIYTIAGELDLAIGGKRTDEVIRLLHADLIAKHILGKRVVLLVEEAQAMPLETLEEIRLFSNLETAHNKLLQIVLFGQPELDESLSLPRMRQLKERITHSFKVPPLTEENIPEFLMFRMQAAGYRGPNLFNRRVVALLSKVSEGVLRRICILTDKTLLAAFADNTHTIETRHVKAAILDSEFSAAPASARLRKMLPTLVVGSVLTLVAGIVFYLSANGYYLATSATKDTLPSTTATTATLATSTTTITTTAATTLPAASPSVAGAGTTTNTTMRSTTGSTAVESTSVTSIAPSTAPAIERPAQQLTPLQQISSVSKAWLQKETPTNYTVQVALLKAEQGPELDQLLRRLRTEIGQGAIHIYPTRVGNSIRFGVVYGSFATRPEGVVIRTKVARKGGYHPKLRTVEGLQEEIASTKSADLWPK